MIMVSTNNEFRPKKKDIQRLAFKLAISDIKSKLGINKMNDSSDSSIDYFFNENKQRNRLSRKQKNKMSMNFD
jgi:hypothetical protein